MKRPHVADCPVGEGRNGLLPIFREENDEEEEEEELGSEKKRRLKVEQVRALERSFEAENKLDPERKARLANDLGLQPRQVAVWFQNRRARWKTKQLERDFAGLRAGCDALALDCDALRQENEALLAKVEQLRAKLKEEEEAKRHRDISTKEETLPAPPDSDSSAVLNEETSPYEGSDWRGERDLSFQYQQQPVVMKLEEESFSELFLVEPVAMPAWFCSENWSLMEGEC